MALLPLLLHVSILSSGDRINLADFGHVVRVAGDTGPGCVIEPIPRGTDGWPAGKLDDGRYAIALFWNRPRRLSEVEIEFRHAIADRGKIRPAILRPAAESAPVGAAPGTPWPDPYGGVWSEPAFEWWAGDRDVGFEFNADDDPMGAMLRPCALTTCRVMFNLGPRDEELPPVRYLRAFGPGTVEDATFEVRFDRDTTLTPPFRIELDNGYLVDDKGKTSTQRREVPGPRPRFGVRFFRDDIDSPNRTMVTVMEGRDRLAGFSFLPAEVLARGIVRIPACGAVVVHVGSTLPLPRASDGAIRLTDRLERGPWPELASGSLLELDGDEAIIPRTQGVALGPLDAQAEFVLLSDGSVRLDRRALTASAAAMDLSHWPDDRWELRVAVGTSADAADDPEVGQFWVEQHMPVARTVWKTEGVRYVQTSVATWLEKPTGVPRGDEPIVLLNEVAIVNSSAGVRGASFRWTLPDGEPGDLRGGEVYAAAGDDLAYRLHVAADVGRLRVAGEGEPGGVIVYETELAGGATETFRWTVPFALPGEVRQVAAVARRAVDEVVARDRKPWDKIASASAAIEIPDVGMTRRFGRLGVDLRVAADRDPRTGFVRLPAAAVGGTVSMPTLASMIRALHVRGDVALVRAILEGILACEARGEPPGCLRGGAGILTVSNHGTVPNDSHSKRTSGFDVWGHGLALQALAEHDAYTRDGRWLQRVSPRLYAAGDFVRRNLSGQDAAWATQAADKGGIAGLLPPGPIGDVEAAWCWFAVNADVWRGMAAIAEALDRIDDPQSRALATLASQFGQRLQRACREDLLRTPVQPVDEAAHLPFQPSVWGWHGASPVPAWDLHYGAIHLLAAGIYEPGSSPATWVLENLTERWLPEALDETSDRWTLRPHLFPGIRVCLSRGEPKLAQWWLRAMQRSVAAPGHADDALADAAAVANGLRDLLIQEEGRDLHLLRGASPGWLQPGQRIALNNCVTSYGTLSLTVEPSADERIALTLDAPARNPARDVVIHLPTPRLLGRVNLAGRPVSSVDPAQRTITLPGDIGRCEIEVLLSP